MGKDVRNYEGIVYVNAYYENVKNSKNGKTLEQEITPIFGAKYYVNLNELADHQGNLYDNSMFRSINTSTKHIAIPVDGIDTVTIVNGTSPCKFIVTTDYTQPTSDTPNYEDVCPLAEGERGIRNMAVGDTLILDVSNAKYIVMQKVADGFGLASSVYCVANSIQENLDNLSERVDAIASGIDIGLSEVSLVGDSTSGGMSNKESIAYMLNKYLSSAGTTMRSYVRGGESTDAMMAYLGCRPMVITDKITIPSSGYVTFNPKSSLVNGDSSFVNYGSFSQFDNTNSRVSISDATIAGVKGTLSAYSASLFAGVCFYNANGTVVKYYTPDDYAKNITGLSVAATSMRVCINAYSTQDVSKATCHVSLNSVAITLIPKITVAGKYLSRDGSLVSKEGFYSSEPIDISSIGTITNLYIDGLATSASVRFLRKTSGESVVVHNGTLVKCDNYSLAKNSIILAYINNFKYTIGRDFADDWKYQMDILLKYGNGKFILGSTHYIYAEKTQSEVEKIESRLISEYGANYFSGYQYLKDCGLTDIVKFGVLTQSQVESAISSGNTNLQDWMRPFQNSTYGDFLHFNKYAAYLIARKFIEIGIELGYWPDGDKSFNTLTT